MLKREGWPVNAKRVYRHYHEMGLRLRNKTPERRVKATLRDDRKKATALNETWGSSIERHWFENNGERTSCTINL